MYKKHTDYGLGFSIFVLLLLAAAIYGWVCNIIAIIHADALFTGMTIARIIGVFVAPLGSVLGFF